MSSKRISRREFLRKAIMPVLAGTTGFPYVVSPAALGKFGSVAASERIVMGFIGVGSMGGGHLLRFAGYDDVQVAAVCDVRELLRRRAKGWLARRFGNRDVVAYNDFRELLAREDIDAVTVVTPEHWHGLIGIEAARQGKSMYCEKPADVNFVAVKAMREAVQRAGVVFQFGTQQRSDNKFRQACELARNGRLGKLHTIMIGSLHSIAFANQPNEPVPAKKEFDYDMWLGPAPWAAYNYERCASRAMGTDGMWTHIYDYSLGGMGGAYGVHHTDIAQWGNGTDDTGPVEIEGTGVLPGDGLADTFLEWDVQMKYANGVRLRYTDTKKARELAEPFNLRGLHWPGCGVLFQGTDGWVIVGRGYIEAEPKGLLKTVFGPDEVRLYRSNDHRRNFLDCVRSRARTICPVETAVRSDTLCHLSDIAIRLGRKLRWDPVKEQFVGDEQANRMLSRPMRSPWRL